MDGDRRQHRADLGQPEPRPQPGGAAQRRHHVLALGARRRPQPLRDLPHQARRHRHVRAVRRAQPGQQLPAPARHGPERQLQGHRVVVADVAVGHRRGRRADVRSTPSSYSEQNTPANTTVPASGGQVQVTERALDMGRGLSLYGRVTTPYPLWDGTDRVLVAYRPCEVTRNGVVVPCATLTGEEIARLQRPRPHGRRCGSRSRCRTTCPPPTRSTCSTRRSRPG